MKFELSVAMIEGTPTLAMIVPLKNPIAIPTMIPQTMARMMFLVARKTSEKMYPENAMIAGKERSISPAVMTKVSPRAMMRVKGTVDKKAM